jgi:hypothetical protein
MKNLILLSLVCLFTVSVKSQNTATYIDGFNNSQWGASEIEVRNNISSRNVNIQKRGNDLIVLNSSYLEIEDCNISWQFNSKGELVRGLILAVPSNSSKALQKYALIERQLELKYGQGKRSDFHAMCYPDSSINWKRTLKRGEDILSTQWSDSNGNTITMLMSSKLQIQVLFQSNS